MSTADLLLGATVLSTAILVLTKGPAAVRNLVRVSTGLWRWGRRMRLHVQRQLGSLAHRSWNAPNPVTDAAVADLRTIGCAGLAESWARAMVALLDGDLAARPVGVLSEVGDGGRVSYCFSDGSRADLFLFWPRPRRDDWTPAYVIECYKRCPYRSNMYGHAGLRSESDAGVFRFDESEVVMAVQIVWRHKVHQREHMKNTDCTEIYEGVDRAGQMSAKLMIRLDPPRTSVRQRAMHRLTDAVGFYELPQDERQAAHDSVMRELGYDDLARFISRKRLHLAWSRSAA